MTRPSVSPLRSHGGNSGGATSVVGAPATAAGRRSSNASWELFNLPTLPRTLCGHRLGGRLCAAGHGRTTHVHSGGVTRQLSRQAAVPSRKSSLFRSPVHFASPLRSSQGATQSRRSATGWHHRRVHAGGGLSQPGGTGQVGRPGDLWRQAAPQRGHSGPCVHSLPYKSTHRLSAAPWAREESPSAAPWAGEESLRGLDAAELWPRSLGHPNLCIQTSASEPLQRSLMPKSCGRGPPKGVERSAALESMQARHVRRPGLLRWRHLLEHVVLRAEARLVRSLRRAEPRRLSTDRQPGGPRVGRAGSGVAPVQKRLSSPRLMAPPHLPISPYTSLYLAISPSLMAPPHARLRRARSRLQPRFSTHTHCPRLLAAQQPRRL